MTRNHRLLRLVLASALIVTTACGDDPDQGSSNRSSATTARDDSEDAESFEEQVEFQRPGDSWLRDVHLPAGSVLVVVAEPRTHNRAVVIVGGSEADETAEREFQNALLDVEPGDMPDGPIGPYSFLLDPLLTAIGGNYLSVTNAFVVDSLEDYGLSPVDQAPEFVLVEGYEAGNRHDHPGVVTALMVTPTAMDVTLIVGSPDAPSGWDVTVRVIPIDADPGDPPAFLAAAAKEHDLTALLEDYY